MIAVRFEPHAQARTVHHMLLYGCDGEPSEAARYGDKSVLMTRMCAESTDRILYGWAKDAPDLHLPPSVGLAVGPAAGVTYLVLQVRVSGSENDLSDLNDMVVSGACKGVAVALRWSHTVHRIRIKDEDIPNVLFFKVHKYICQHAVS